MNALHVAHWPSNDGSAVKPLPASAGLAVTTCLRQVWISAAPVIAAGNAERYAGQAAYRFLLEFVTGLHSAIPGETNVLGQFRQAWLRWRDTAPVASSRLAGTIDSLLKDARFIRARYLQGVGGDSYGSLVRRLIRPARGERVLVAGAGELAQSVWPFFRQQTVGSWNRSAGRGPTPDGLLRFAPGEGQRAAHWAQHVIMATPPDAENDARWIAWLNAARPRTVAHLGHREPGAFRVANAGQSFCLDQLFELRQTQANVRSLQVARAGTACQDLAARLNCHVDSAPRRARA